MEISATLFSQFLEVMKDLPGYLTMWTQMMGPWIYVLLFAIIFAETGLIVTPFLPGDSLLFAVGALTAIEGGLSFPIVVVSLIIAALCGDLVNYSVGRYLGLRLFNNSSSKIFNPAYLHRTQAFYERHGGKTIVLARFLPILRTYAPFVAGLGRMQPSKYATFCVCGAIAWIATFVTAGHFFGGLPGVKSNFHYVIGAIIVISVIPAVVEVIKARRHAAAQSTIGQ